MSQAPQLRKYEPHPVGLFAAASQFGAYAIIDGILRLDETLEFAKLIGI